MTLKKKTSQILMRWLCIISCLAVIPLFVSCNVQSEVRNDRPYDYYIDCDEGIYLRETDTYTFSLHIREEGFTGTFSHNGTTVMYDTEVDQSLLLYNKETNELIGACALDKVNDMIIVRRLSHPDLKPENDLFAEINSDLLILMANEQLQTQ